MDGNKDLDYGIESDSDQEGAIDSSDDDIDVILHGTPEQKRRLRRRSLGQKSSSSEDEFEKGMEAELNATMKRLQDKCSDLPNQAGGSTPSDTKSQPKPNYQADYFDSDSDEEMSSAEKKQSDHPVPSNADLLYDPSIDDDNQKWVDNKRRKYQPAQQQESNKQDSKPATKPLPHSDAVLDCPACMTTLCMDCQRHSKYNNQYRAMFVMNCSVISGEVLRYPEKGPGKKNNKKKRNNDPSQMTEEGTSVNDDSAAYHPVKCIECNTEVGVYDSDEIYHFFNVLARY